MQSDKREIYQTYNTLNAIPLMLVNRNIMVDLQNESFVAGKLVHADGFMNLELEDVVQINQRGEYEAIERLSLQNRSIRYIHLPEDMEVVPELQRFMESFAATKTKAKNKYARKPKPVRKRPE